MASRSYKKQLQSALKYFESRELTENSLLSHDLYMVSRDGLPLVEEEVDRKDYILSNGKRLRIYLVHPNKVEHVLGVDMIYECYDMTYGLARFAHLQYKTWKGNTLVFDDREDRQLLRMKSNICDCNLCQKPSAFVSAEPYRFPYCAAFVRPTNKILTKSTKMVSKGDHIPLCQLNGLRLASSDVNKTDLQEISISKNLFEEGFNKISLGVWLDAFRDLKKFYQDRKLFELANNVRFIAQEVGLKDEDL